MNHRVSRLVFASLVLFSAAAFAEDKADIQELVTRAMKARSDGKLTEAVKLFDRVIASNKKASNAYYYRGRINFRLGKIAESIADLDQVAKLRPKRERELWERGISHYYVGRYKQGAAQFALYQTYHDNDVENSVWRYLCMAREQNVKKAREKMLPIKNDTRVPMMKIYAMYRGRASADDVLTAARAGKPTDEQLNGRLFYAHLYIGLFHEADGKAKLARKHILLAEKHKIGHYMWDVAHVHAQLLRKKEQGKKKE